MYRSTIINMVIERLLSIDCHIYAFLKGALLLTLIVLRKAISQNIPI